MRALTGRHFFSPVHQNYYKGPYFQTFSSQNLEPGLKGNHPPRHRPSQHYLSPSPFPQSLTSLGLSPTSLNFRGVLLRAYLQPLKYMLQEQPKEKEAPQVLGSLPWHAQVRLQEGQEGGASATAVVTASPSLWGGGLTAAPLSEKHRRMPVSPSDPRPQAGVVTR